MIKSETKIVETEFGIRVSGDGVTIEVENTVMDYLRARQFIFLVANHVVTGSIKDINDHFTWE